MCTNARLWPAPSVAHTKQSGAMCQNDKKPVLCSSHKQVTKWHNFVNFENIKNLKCFVHNSIGHIVYKGDVIIVTSHVYIKHCQSMQCIVLPASIL